MTITWPAIALGIGVLIAYGIVLKGMKFPATWSGTKGLLLGILKTNAKAMGLVLAILLVSSAPVGKGVWDTRQVNREASLVKAQFQEWQTQTNPTTTAIVQELQPLPDTWVVSYTNDGAEHLVLRVGGQWLPISMEPTSEP